jgi:hypothetical protein
LSLKLFARPAAPPPARDWGLVVDYLYKTLLGRAPDPVARANCVAWLESGASIEDVHQQIIGSEEYAQGRGDSPVAHIPEVYRPENISYFTHRGRFRPLALSIETVNICNNDCVICPYSIQTRKRQAMAPEIFAKVIDDYDALGGGPVTLTPMVGEVFLDKRLKERLDRLRATPSITRVSAITNASMAHLYDDAELAELLAGFDRLSISVYGLDADEYEAMSRTPYYERFLEGAARLLRLGGLAKVSLGARHLKHRSQDEIDAWLAALAERARVDTARVRFAGTRTYANWGVFDTSRPLPFEGEWMAAQTNTAQCALPLISLQILSDGRVSFCGCADFDGKSELMLGDIRENTLAELLGGQRVRDLWRWDLNGVPEPCKGCTFHMPISRLAELPSAFTDPLETFGG